jgi:hypothetical protein
MASIQSTPAAPPTGRDNRDLLGFMGRIATQPGLHILQVPVDPNIQRWLLKRFPAETTLIAAGLDDDLVPNPSQAVSGKAWLSQRRSVEDVLALAPEASAVVIGPAMGMLLEAATLRQRDRLSVLVWRNTLRQAAYDLNKAVIFLAPQADGWDMGCTTVTYDQAFGASRGDSPPLPSARCSA